MLLCRTACRNLWTFARKSAAQFPKNAVPRRGMSSGVPGGTGENIVYFALCGASFAAGLAYAYKTVLSDQVRYSDRVAELQARPKDEWQPKPWPPKGGSEEEPEMEEAGKDGGDTAEEEAVVAEAASEEAVAVAEAEPVSKETVANAAVGPVVESAVAEAVESAVEAALAEAMEEPPVEAAPASAESDGVDPPVEEVQEEEQLPELPVLMPDPISTGAPEMSAASVEEVEMGDVPEDTEVMPADTTEGEPRLQAEVLQDHVCVQGDIGINQTVEEVLSGQADAVPEAVDKCPMEELAVTIAINQESDNVAATEQVTVDIEAVDTAVGKEPETTIDGGPAVLTATEKEPEATVSINACEELELIMETTEPVDAEKETEVVTEPADNVQREAEGIAVTTETVDAVEKAAEVVTETAEPADNVQQEPEGVTVTQDTVDAVEKAAEVVTEPAENVQQEPEGIAVTTGTVDAVDKAAEVVTETAEPADNVQQEPEGIAVTTGTVDAVEKAAEVVTETAEPADNVQQEPECVTVTTDTVDAVEKAAEVSSGATEPMDAIEEEQAIAIAKETTALVLEESAVSEPLLEEMLQNSVIDIAVPDPELNVFKGVKLEATVEALQEIPEVEATARPSEQIELTQVLEVEHRDVTQTDGSALVVEDVSSVSEEKVEDGDQRPAFEMATQAASDVGAQTGDAACTNEDTVPAPLAVGTAAEDAKGSPVKEYIVVVLEGMPKEPKTPKVLAIAPVTGSTPVLGEARVPASASETRA